MSADFNQWFFTTNVSNSGNTCPESPFKCFPPNACARDSINGRNFCCDAGDNPVCWGPAAACKTDGTTFKCGDSVNSWCCMLGREECTRSTGQINICWSKQGDPLKQIDILVLQSLHSSLSTANPTSTTLAFDPLKLIALTAPTTSATTSPGAANPTPTMTSTSSSSSSTRRLGALSSPTSSPSSSSNPVSSSPGLGPSTSSTSSLNYGTGVAPDAAESSTTTSYSSSQTSGAALPASPDSSSLSTGAVAGIAVGSAAGMALIAAIAFMLWWRRRKRAESLGNSNGSAIAGYGAAAGMKQFPYPGAPGGPQGPAGPYSAYPSGLGPADVQSMTIGRGGTIIQQVAPGPYGQYPHPHPHSNPHPIPFEYYNHHSPSPESPPYAQHPPYPTRSPDSQNGLPSAVPSELPTGHNNFVPFELPVKHDNWQPPTPGH